MTWEQYEQLFYQLQDWEACNEYMEEHGLVRLWEIDAEGDYPHDDESEWDL